MTEVQSLPTEDLINELQARHPTIVIAAMNPPISGESVVPDASMIVLRAKGEPEDVAWLVNQLTLALMKELEQTNEE